MKSVHMRIPQETYEKFKSVIEGETISSAVNRLMKEEIQYLSNEKKNEIDRVIRIINNKKYDTSTAKIVSSKRYNSGLVINLFKKNTGELFIYCYGLGGDIIHLPDIITQTHEQFAYYLSDLDIDESTANYFDE